MENRIETPDWYYRFLLQEERSMRERGDTKFAEMINEIIRRLAKEKSSQ